MTASAMRGRVLRADAMVVPGGLVSDAELVIGEDGRIAYAGARGGAGSRPEGAEVHELGGCVLMPGLVNGHTHSAMTLMRGVSDDDGFTAWLAAVQRLEAGLTRDDIAAGLQLAMLEMIETGTTAFADMYYWDAGLLELVRGAGMRVLAAPASFAPETVGFAGVSPMSGAEVTDLTERLGERFAGDAQIRIAYGPHAPYTSPPGFLRDIAERSARTGLRVHTHVSEARDEVSDALRDFGATPLEHLAALGLVGERLHAAHCVHLTAPEIALAAERGASISHNPVSNLKLGNGVAPLPELVEAGARVALGSDSVASNNSLDLFEEMKLTAILHRAGGRGGSVTAATVLDLATRRGAEAIGFPETGALEAGRLADAVAVDLGGARGATLDATSFEAVVSHLVYAARGGDVRHVFIGGRHVYAEGEHLTLDAADIAGRAGAAAARLRELLA